MKLKLSSRTVILMTVFIDILGAGIVIPILPFYVQSFGASPLTMTLLFSVFSLCAFFSAPYLGALSDRIGRRPILLVSIASTALGWLVFASARSVWVLFAARIVDGLAAGNVSTAQSYMSDMATTDQERTHNFGLIGALWGVGLIIGSFLGGVLSQVSHTFPFWFVGALASLNLVLAYFMLPETHHERTQGKVELNPIAPIAHNLADSVLLPSLIMWFLVSMAISMQQSVFALFLGSAFGFGELAAGISLACVGAIVAFNQGVLLKKFWIRRFSEADLELGMLALFALGFVFHGMRVIALFALGVFIVTMAQSVLRVVTMSQVSVLRPKKRGEVLGLMNSIMSLAMIAGPALAGALFEYNIQSPFFVAALVSAGAFFIAWQNRRMLARLKFSEPEQIPETL